MMTKTIQHLLYSHSVYICSAPEVFSQTDVGSNFSESLLTTTFFYYLLTVFYHKSNVLYRWFVLTVFFFYFEVHEPSGNKTIWDKMKATLKKIILASILSAVPLAVIIYNNFIHFGRGWHTMLLQYHSYFWLTRFLLTPFLVFVTLKLWHNANNPFKLFLYPSIIFFVYNFLCWAISFVSCRLLAPSFDGRNRNLFNTIRYESTLLNLLIYIATILLVFIWLYYERDKESETKTLELEKSLAEVKLDLAKIQTNITKETESKKSCCVTVKNGHKTFLIPISEISSIQSNGPYTKIVTETGSYLLKRGLSEFQKMLPGSFLRVHRCSIVNMEFVKEFRSLLNGDALLILKNEKEVRLSRTYRASVIAVLGKG